MVRRIAASLIAVGVVLGLCGCGMGKAYSDTGKMFDKFGCMSRDIKGQPACPAEDS